MTLYGDGKQTRSFCFVNDLVDGLIRLMNIDEDKNTIVARASRGPAALKGQHEANPGDVYGPVNLGNPVEFTMVELANLVTEIVAKARLDGDIAELPSRNTIQLNDNTSSQSVVFCPLPIDDPKQRKPDITRANYLLNWGESKRHCIVTTHLLTYHYLLRLHKGPSWTLEKGLYEMVLWVDPSLKSRVIN